MTATVSRYGTPGTGCTGSTPRTARTRDAAPGGRGGLALLSGPDAHELLAVALATVGAGLVRHDVHLVQHRPGDGVTVGHCARVRWPGGGETDEYLLLSTSSSRDIRVDAPGVAVIEGPLGRILAWRHPQDPALPALGLACTPAALAGQLPGGGAVESLELVGYRPLRRAVLRAVRADRTFYVKVLRPGRARGGVLDVVHRHTALSAAGLPVPAALAATDDGLVVLEEAAGTPLVEAIGRDGGRGLEASDLVGLLDTLPAEVMRLRRRPAWSDRADDYADAVAASGRWGGRAAAVARGVRELSSTVDLGPVVPTHGDFHEGQLTVVPGPTGWRLAGLLDVDTVGPGHRVDDLACVLAHAIALGRVGSGAVRRWEAQAREHVDPRALAVRTAGVLLSLAAGAAHGAPGGAPAADLLGAAEHQLLLAHGPQLLPTAAAPLAPARRPAAQPSSR